MTTLFFGTMVLIALFFAFATRDWRLKTVATACSLVWISAVVVIAPRATSIWWLDPAYTVALLLLMIAIQARGEVERARGEPLALWLLIPMGVETVIAASYLVPSAVLPALAQLQIIQVGFAVELLTIIVVGGRRLEIVRRLRAWAASVATMDERTA